MTDKINKLCVFYENEPSLPEDWRKKQRSNPLPKNKKKNPRGGDQRKHITISALLLVNTLVFGQYTPPQFIHIVIHTQICMYIHTLKRVINWIFVHVCVHTFFFIKDL